MGKNNSSIRFMTQLALLIAVELVMKMVGLGMVPIGALKCSFLSVPVAVGAMILGPLGGTILGFVFGAISFYDALTAPSAMTAAFMAASPFLTFVLCVVTRTIMGLCTSLIFMAIKNMKSSIKYFIGALAAPLLNTTFFMGFLVMVFYNTEYVQQLVTALGAANPIVFIVLLVGIQAVVEAVACCIVGGACAKGVDVVINRGK